MLEILHATLNTLTAQRVQVATEGWTLQRCWLVQVKPGGTARTTSKYWQVRSREPMFDGKTLKHLKPDEVEDYRGAIARGRQLSQLDREIEKLQQKITRLSSAAGSLQDRSKASAPQNVPQTGTQPRTEQQIGERGRSPTPPSTSPSQLDLASQEHLVKHVLDQSQELRESVLESGMVNQMKLTELAEQKRLVKELLAKSQSLRQAVRESSALNRQLRVGAAHLRAMHPQFREPSSTAD